MGYIAQIANITPKVLKAEKWALQRIAHIPHNAFPKDTFFYQHEIGKRSINPPSSQLASCSDKDCQNYLLLEARVD